MYLSITYIKLRSPWQFFSLTYQAMKIVKQSQQFGSLGWKNSGFWRDHYTMSLWKSREDIQNFYRSGAHAESMKRSSQMCTEIATLTIEASEFLSWAEAKQKIHSEGKKIYFS